MHVIDRGRVKNYFMEEEVEGLLGRGNAQDRDAAPLRYAWIMLVPSSDGDSADLDILAWGAREPSVTL